MARLIFGLNVYKQVWYWRLISDSNFNVDWTFNIHINLTSILQSIWLGMNLHCLLGCHQSWLQMYCIFNPILCKHIWHAVSKSGAFYYVIIEVFLSIMPVMVMVNILVNRNHTFPYIFHQSYDNVLFYNSCVCLL